MAQRGTRSRPQGVMHSSAVLSSVAALGLLVVLGDADRARASNCVLARSELLSPVLSPSGVLFVKISCPGEAAGCQELPSARVEHDGAEVLGSLQIVQQTPFSLWVTFRPDAPWQSGSYIVSGLPEWFNTVALPFDVQTDAASFVFDEAQVMLALAVGAVPEGERVCCPSKGEGDCAPSCGGADGERIVAEVQATLPPYPSAVIWALAPHDAPDEMAFGIGLQFSEPAPDYCVRVQAWDTYDDTRHVFVRCLGGLDAAVGKVRADWSAMELAMCSAPPLPGGWGYDVRGVPDTFEETPEPLRLAFCMAQAPACASVGVPAPSATRCINSDYCPCAHFAEYCPEYTASEAQRVSESGGDDGAGNVSWDVGSGGPDRETQSGCALTSGRADASWLALVLAGLLPALRRRKRGYAPA